MKKYLVAGIVIVLFAARVGLLLYQEQSETLPHYIGHKEMLVGRVAEDPDARDTAMRVVLDDLSIDNSAISGKLLVSLPPNTPVSYGDTLEVKGTVTAPQSFTTDTGHVFDYPNYLRVQGISAELSYATLLDARRGGLALFGALFSLKHIFERSLERLIPNPENALLQGELLGERHGISQVLTDAFVKSGLVHIVVLSGYNISIIALAIFWLLAPLPRRARFALGGAAMLLFALMTGLGASTLRALVMSLVALLANYLRRPALALRMLALAAFALALWNPLLPLYDPSYILSVLATFGIITLSPWVDAHLSRIKMLRKQQLYATREILAATLSVELFVTPALLYFSGVLSLLSLPANALVLPLVPATMLFGFLAGVLGLVSPLLALAPAFVAYMLLKFTLMVVATVTSLPLSSIIVPQFSPWILIAAYIPLGWFAMRTYNEAQKINLASSSKGH